MNASLLLISTLEPVFSRKVCLETARKLLHQLGFDVLTTQEGIFIDGHEHSDVVESRKLLLCKMFKVGFLHFTNAPTEDAANSLMTDIDAPVSERRAKQSFSSMMTQLSRRMRISLLSGGLKEKKC